VIFGQLAGEGAVAEVFGEGATAAEAFELLTVDVPAASWIEALTAARSVLGCTFFDWLSAVDEPGHGFHVAAHLVAVGTPVRRLLLRTLVPADAPALPTATGVYAGAAWHERETHEMFGIDFPGHPHLVPLLLPDEFEGHPLRKDFVLAARVAKAWPGAKEPGESEQAPRRRQMQPPGVPDPNEWGPLKGTLGAEPTGRAARTRDAAAGGAAVGGAAAGGAVADGAGAGDVEVGGAGVGSAGAGDPGPGGGAQGAAAGRGGPGRGAAGGDRPARPPRADRPRRNRSASQGSASQTAADQVSASHPPGSRAGDKPWELPTKPDPATGPRGPQKPPEARPPGADAAPQRGPAGPEEPTNPEGSPGSEPVPETGPDGEAGAASGEGA
jgi:NADH:ubiquinone oxidoreductase subunit C